MSLSVLSAAFGKLLPFRRSEFVVTSLMPTRFSKLNSSTEVWEIWPMRKMVMSVLFCEEGSEIGKSKSARTVHNALRWLDRLVGLGRIGQGWPDRRAPEAAI
jgi:hypothetical protein